MIDAPYNPMGMEEDYFICLPSDGIYRPEDWPPEVQAHIAKRNAEWEAKIKRETPPEL